MPTLISKELTSLSKDSLLLSWSSIKGLGIRLGANVGNRLHIFTKISKLESLSNMRRQVISTSGIGFRLLNNHEILIHMYILGW